LCLLFFETFLELFHKAEDLQTKARIVR
jgi:hypothetical protein